MILAVLCTLSGAFLYQLVARPLYTFDGVAPDFVLAAVCALSVYSRPAAALVAAVACGAVFDTVSLDPWSAHALAYLGASWFVLRARVRGWTRNVAALFGSIAAASVLATAVRYAIIFIHDGSDAQPGWFSGAFEAIFSSAMSCVVVALLAPHENVLSGPGRRSEFHRLTTTS